MNISILTLWVLSVMSDLTYFRQAPVCLRVWTDGGRV